EDRARKSASPALKRLATFLRANGLPCCAPFGAVIRARYTSLRSWSTVTLKTFRRTFGSWNATDSYGSPRSPAGTATSRSRRCRSQKLHCGSRSESTPAPGAERFDLTNSNLGRVESGLLRKTRRKGIEGSAREG